MVLNDMIQKEYIVLIIFNYTYKVFIFLGYTF